MFRSLIFNEYLAGFDEIGPGIDFIFFPGLVSLAVVEDFMYQHGVFLSVDITTLWTMAVLPIALPIDGALWFVTAGRFLRRILLDDPRPFVAFFVREFPALAQQSWLCFDWPFCGV
ncbi:hypothetical protein M426DRAFT_223127 [Hypoxylon sp. CI-4A]|nr:hypothetical protein M426DRAFT_223127 [Hypoxylon sp. CI-4A]